MNRPLYDRLPEIYRIKDGEQDPPGQLAALLEPVEQMFDTLDRSLVELYHDFFIETCADWAIPYLGAQLGVVPLRGDTWAQRADLADTMAMRRRKGTLTGLGLAVRDLTGWGFRLREFFQDLARCQHLNHLPKPTFEGLNRFTTPVGGTANLRAPQLVRQLAGPWESLAHLPDLRPANTGRAAVNLPNLGIFLWRLESYRLALIKPKYARTWARAASIDLTEFPDAAAYAVRIDISRLGRPLQLFGTNPTGMDEDPPRFPGRGELAGLIPVSELNQDQPGTHPYDYVDIATYDNNQAFPSDLKITEKALQLNLPAKTFPATKWRIRGANLGAWERGLYPPLNKDEIAIDPVIGRLVFGVAKSADGQAIGRFLHISHQVGTVGAIGALPENRLEAPEQFAGEKTLIRRINGNLDPLALAVALDDVHELTQPLVVEIEDCLIHDLDLTSLRAHTVQDGKPALRISRSVIVRAVSGQMPIIRLSHPLALRPAQVVGSDAAEQAQIDAVNSSLTVRLEGLYLTRGEFLNGPLITRVALNALELWNTTLDPGGDAYPHMPPSPALPSISLTYPYGFSDAAEEKAFKETPQLLLRQVLTGALMLPENYRLHLENTIIHAGAYLGDSNPAFAISGNLANPSSSWGPITSFSGVTCFGRIRVVKLSGKGGLLPFPVEVQEHTSGCIKRSFFAAEGNRLPQHHECISAADAVLGFTSQLVNHPALGQLTSTCDYRLREHGPNDCAMGAFGFMQEAHKWRNLEIRFREMMLVGIRPVLIPMN